MQTTLKRLVKLSAGYSLVTLIGPLFTILLTPLYTRVLSPADYGAIDIAVALSSLLTAIVLLGIDQALVVHYFDGSRADTHTETHQHTLVKSALVLVGLIGLIVAVIIAVWATPLAQWLYRGDAFRANMLYIVALNALAAPLYTVLATWRRLSMSVKQVNLLGLIYLFTLVVTNGVFILVLGLKATGALAAMTLANVATCGVGLWLGRVLWPVQPNLAAMRKLFGVGVGVLPGTLAYLVLSGIDRLMLTQYVSLDEQGWYGIANKLASMLFVLAGAALSAWQPMALEMAHQPDAPRQIARVFEIFLVGSMLLALLIGLFASQILSVFTRAAYLPAAPYALVLLAYTGPITFAASLFAIGLYARKQTHWLSLTLILSAAVNVGLNLLLNPRFGVWGATWATLAAGLVFALGNYLAAQRIYPVNYRWLRISAVSAVFALIVALQLLVPVTQTVLIKIICLSVFIAATFMLGMVAVAHVQAGGRFIRAQVARYLV